MAGTIICSVSDPEDGRAALELAVDLGERLGLRLVLAHVGDGTSGLQNGSLTRLAREYGVEKREAVGDEAALLARIAAEEAADIIVVAARPRRRFRRGLETTLAGQLETETSVPVLIAPRRKEPSRR